MLKTMLAMVAVAMTLQTAPVPAAPARGSAPAPTAKAPVTATTNAQVKARGTRRVKPTAASAASTTRPQQNTAVYIPRCYDCPM